MDIIVRHTREGGRCDPPRRPLGPVRAKTTGAGGGSYAGEDRCWALLGPICGSRLDTDVGFVEPLNLQINRLLLSNSIDIVYSYLKLSGKIHCMVETMNSNGEGMEGRTASRS